MRLKPGSQQKTGLRQHLGCCRKFGWRQMLGSQLVPCFLGFDYWQPD
ncbi:helix-turn-helix domain-containing protein [Abiotrophia defectiva]